MCVSMTIYDWKLTKVGSLGMVSRGAADSNMHM